MVALRYHITDVIVENDSSVAVQKLQKDNMDATELGIIYKNI
ncbi:hypothetical protein LINGRAHAP2_LOCUS1981 [Linum grandiflorum]